MNGSVPVIDTLRGFATMIPMNRRTLLTAVGASLLAVPAGALAQQQAASATPAGFAGRVFVNERGGVRLHTYLAAAQGAMAISHVVETASGLVVVDGQFTPDAARELKRYVDALGKPVLRLVLSR